ncbi:hypothetical protein A2533_00075 [Candidatus Falkowbacteria bacterium RIFOXYD2_FULL_35_9]|uniref:cysteine desulfurase n=1 Tax=Candidatus Falkowbacteria bacterium RIFOXYC2_FULL_36_12 TaxID=1798002 RepID=A0A1F5SYN9_9BACT|nr:MAG: hypothetical protein A2300_03270 [Candidatus Falkowbacteria bacterium RIFOXYB2_FULL_35_7]OGF31838.1 MAG: hypothetical protein A2478_05135 [Candidatus Falkowbacteria bacterium RIFOXYC2_FULL_36_12]OGF34639.1 MAG: hypothetical protein A2223_00635 [Candidatus Falkowbacteria bacterium RIFOXYA2_FULL_35_8]OGF45730.1 MAG: hypothetical protein A2533_00075 [Candidatus Falkowbacteria bacterium RIFOXYD2_FULL_35_9]
MPRIYFDNAATTKVDSRVVDAMLPFFSDEYGNPSSIHSFGQETSTAIESAREKISGFLGANDPQEIVFTSCATESNNLAIWGIFNKFKIKKKKLHFITSKIEHPSVLQVFKKIEKLGHEVSFIEVDHDGIIKLEQLRKEIKANTVLVSIMSANNEVGSIQPVEEIGEIIAKEKIKRQNKELPIFFHTDAVQALNYLEINVAKIKCDLLSFSGHKIYAPMGIGVLFIRKGVSLEPLMQGGSHEFNLRPGTSNVPGIVGLGKAIEILDSEKEKTISKVKKIKEKIIHELKDVKDIRFNGNPDKQLPNLLNISFYGAEGESILMMLDMEGIAISTGSACSSGALEPSYVLTAMGIPVEWTHGSIRVSLGRFNSEQEVSTFVTSLKQIVEKLRQMAPALKQ